ARLIARGPGLDRRLQEARAGACGTSRACYQQGLVEWRRTFLPQGPAMPAQDATANELHVVILAAGEGKRMKSALPKVLQKVAGRPMLSHVLAAARELSPAAIHVVYGHGGDQVREAYRHRSDINWVEQARQLGTGHAVR